MREVDYGVTPARNLNHAIFGNTHHGGLFVANEEAIFFGHFWRNAIYFANRTKRLLHGLGRLNVERNGRPLFRQMLVFTDAGVGLARLDRQQLDGRRLGRVVHQLRRTHRGATCRRWQHAATVIGKKYRINQFRLATRKLSNEGHVQTILVQFFKQLPHPQISLCVTQFVFGQPLPISRQAIGKMAAPLTIGDKLLRKRHELS